MVVQIWRAGCIIRADHIAGLLEETFRSSKTLDARNLLYNEKLVEELKQGFEPLKRVVLKATEANAVIPSLSATLEYLKYNETWTCLHSLLRQSWTILGSTCTIRMERVMVCQ